MPERLFVAINPPASVRDNVWNRTAPLRRVEGVRWVDAEQLHVTLKFIGGATAEHAEELETALDRVAAVSAPISLSVDAPGAFPGWRRPRVVWLGLRPCPELGELQARVEVALVAAGCAREERPFHPHITLGRARRGRTVSPREIEAAASEVRAAGEWQVDRLELMRSRLGPSGAAYEVRRSFPLTDRRGDEARLQRERVE